MLGLQGGEPLLRQLLGALLRHRASPGTGAPLRVVQMQYTWAYAYSPAFVSVRSYAELAAGEAAGRLVLTG